jgi:hypothetical protein
LLASVPRHKHGHIAQLNLTLNPRSSVGTNFKVNAQLVRLKLIATQACAGHRPLGEFPVSRIKS